jgi:hypothetical protein
MTSVLPITTRNFSARVVLNNGARLVLREVLFGEQIRLSNGKFAEAVTPMKDGRFRLLQIKNGMRAPIDLTAQHVDKITRRGSTGGLGPIPKPQPEDVGQLDIVQQGLPFSGTLQSFYGRAVLQGTDDKTGEERVVLLSDVQSVEVKRRRPEPRATPVVAGPDAVGANETEVEVTITAEEMVSRPDAASPAGQEVTVEEPDHVRGT